MQVQHYESISTLSGLPVVFLTILYHCVSFPVAKNDALRLVSRRSSFIELQFTLEIMMKNMCIHIKKRVTCVNFGEMGTLDYSVVNLRMVRAANATATLLI